MAQSITLQTSDDDVIASDVLGRLSFAASNDSSGGDAILIGGSIYAMAEATFSAVSNPTSIIFATASSESATPKLKIESQGHFVPINNEVYDLGTSSYRFRSTYSENIETDKIVFISGSVPPVSVDNSAYNVNGELFFSGSGVALLPSGGLEKQILQKVNTTTNLLQWVDNYSTEVRVYVKNTTGSALTKGQAVYINSAQGDHPTIALAIASGESSSSKTLGLLYQNLAINEFGYVVAEGTLEGVDTSAAGQAGDLMYLSPTTPGGIVYGLANKPSAPNHLVFLGYVIVKQQNNGKVFVKVQNGFELEELHNVKINGVTNGQYLVYNSSSGVWANQTVNPGGGTTITNYADNRILTSDGTSTGINAESNLIFDGTNLGIGTSDPLRKLTITGGGFAFVDSGGAARLIHWGNTDNTFPVTMGGFATSGNCYLNFSTNTFGNAGTERMRIDSAGSVGIGTSSPSNRLHVQGGELYKTTTDFVFGTTGSLVTTYHGASTGNTYGAIGALSAGGGAWNNLVLQAGGGNVGIGTTSPTQKLHITGVLRIGGGGNQSTGEINLDDGVTQYTGNAFQIRKDSSSYWALKSVTAGNDLALFVDNTVGRGLYITNTTGNVGIGTTSPATRLHVAGTSSTFNGLLLTTTAAGGGAYASIEIGTYYPTWTVASPASLRFIDDNNFSTHITFRTKTSGSASNSDVERFRITSAGNTEIRANAGNVSSAFVYNENGGELVHYDETQTAATLLDQSANQTRLLELINGSNLVLGLGGSNTTGSIVFVRAGYNEAMRIDSTGAAWMKTTRAWNDAVPTLSIGNDADGRLQTRHIWGKASASAAAEHLWLQHGNTNNHVQIGATGGANNLYVVGDIYANGYFGGALLLYGASGMRRGVHQITNWNQTTLPDVAFLSSENSVTNAPTTDFSYGIQYAFHRSGAAFRTQLVTSLYSDLDIWVRNSRDSDVWTAWKKLLHSSNYNSYSPTLTGGGASGTWGINITGNAATVGSLSIHAGVNNEANKIVRTDGSGYLYTGWINTISGELGSPKPTRLYASTDAFIRYYPLATFKAHMGLTGKNVFSRAETTTDSNYWVGSMGWGNTNYNTVFGWGSGFTDVWDSPANQPPGTTHWQGIQALHYDNGANSWGFQIACGAGNPDLLYIRGAWGGAPTSWRRIAAGDSRNTRGATRLYRNDNDSDYSVQTYWTGARWRLNGYVGDTFHAGTEVAYADTAGSIPSLALDINQIAKVGHARFGFEGGTFILDYVRGTITSVRRVAEGRYEVTYNTVLFDSVVAMSNNIHTSYVYLSREVRVYNTSHTLVDSRYVSVISFTY